METAVSFYSIKMFLRLYYINTLSQMYLLVEQHKNVEAISFFFSFSVLTQIGYSYSLCRTILKSVAAIFSPWLSLYTDKLHSVALT